MQCRVGKPYQDNAFLDKMLVVYIREHSMNRIHGWLAMVLTFSMVGAHAAGDAEKAKEKVTQICAACHAPDGNSVITANPKLAGQHEAYLIKQLTNFKEGKRKNAVMSGMASALTEEDIQNLAAYFSIQTLKLGSAKTNGAGSLGEKIYRGGIAASGVPACAACHGANGAGLPKQFPALSGQHAEYTLNQLRTFRTGERANGPMMMTIAAKMKDEEMQAVADYIQGLR